MELEKRCYVYYSYEQFGKGYIGYRKCPKNKTPEIDNYFGSFSDKSFKPTEKIILFQDLTKEEALEIEIKLHDFYDIDKNTHFANKSKQKSLGFSFSGPGNKNPNYGKKHSEESSRKQSEAQKIKVITSPCCYFSVKDAYEELGISITKFYKRFEKDPNTGFYMERSLINNK